MAACDPFDVTVDGDLAPVLAQVKTKVEALGGVFQGDLNSGSLSGHVPLLGDVAADYAVAGNTVTITITHKPLFVSCSTLEAKITDFFAAQ
jgi:hypothetical protein